MLTVKNILVAIKLFLEGKNSNSVFRQVWIKCTFFAKILALFMIVKVKVNWKKTNKLHCLPLHFHKAPQWGSWFHTAWQRWGKPSNSDIACTLDTGSHNKPPCQLYLLSGVTLWSWIKCIPLQPGKQKTKFRGRKFRDWEHFFSVTLFSPLQSFFLLPHLKHSWNTRMCGLEPSYIKSQITTILRKLPCQKRWKTATGFISWTQYFL